MKKKKPVDPKRRTRIAIAIGATIISLVIFIYYNLDQAQISGQRFGDNLAQIQSDLKNESLNYDGKIMLYEKGQITKQKILETSEKHLTALDNILLRYNTLKPPQNFASSLELFKLSTQTQIDSDKLLKEWIEIGDNSTKIKSNELLQRSFEYENSAINSFNKAKENS